MFCESIDPNAGGGDGFAEAKLDARPADVLAVHGAYRLNNARYRLVLAESIARTSAASFLYIDFDDPSIVLEFIP